MPVLACTSSSAPRRMRPRRHPRAAGVRDSEQRPFIDDESNPGNGRPFLPSRFFLRRAAAPGTESGARLTDAPLRLSGRGKLSPRQRPLFSPAPAAFPPMRSGPVIRRRPVPARQQHQQVGPGARMWRQLHYSAVQRQVVLFCRGGLLGASRTMIGQRRLSREQERTQRCRYRTQHHGAGNIGVQLFLREYVVLARCMVE